MKKYFWTLFANMIFACGVANAQEMTLPYAERLQEDEVVQAIEQSKVNLYWGDTVAPKIAEVARPDVYTRSSISLGLRGGGEYNCKEAFDRVLKATISAARDRGYDVVMNIKQIRGEAVSDDPVNFHCQPGYRTTEISLQSIFGMTPQALKKYQDKEQRLIGYAPREAAKNAIYLPLNEVLTSPEGQKLLNGIPAKIGMQQVPYIYRFGPDDYAGEAQIKAGNRMACEQAVLSALQQMKDEAGSRKYDAIIKIRSHLDEMYSPNLNEYECRVMDGWAYVVIQASLSSAK